MKIPANILIMWVVIKTICNKKVHQVPRLAKQPAKNHDDS